MASSWGVSMSDEAVKVAATKFLAEITECINEKVQGDRLYVMDVQEGLRCALEQSVGEAGGVVLLWWDQANGMQINVARHPTRGGNDGH